MRVTIVGAGIAGLSTAWSLIKLAHGITLIAQALDTDDPATLAHWLRTETV